MLEPQNETEANLHAAVELGQRLLRRNQTLLEEQVTYRRLLEEKDEAIASLKVKLDHVERSVGGDTSKVDELVRGKFAVERELHIARDQLVDSRKTVEELRGALRNNRDKDHAERLNTRVADLVMSLQQREDEIAKLTNQARKSDALVATLRRELAEASTSAHENSLGHQNCMPSLSGGASSDGSGFRPFEESPVAEGRVGPLLRQVERLEDSLCEQQSELQRRVSAIETKDVIIHALQSTVTELQQKVEELEIELSRQRYDQLDPSFQTMVQAVPVAAMMNANAVVSPRSAAKGENGHLDSADDDMTELITFKVKWNVRVAADQEFLARWQKLMSLLEESRISVVEKGLQMAGNSSPCVEDLMSIAEARLEAVADAASLMTLSPQLRDLPYAKEVFAHMTKHVTLVKTLNQTVINLKMLQLQTGMSFSQIMTPSKKK